MEQIKRDNYLKRYNSFRVSLLVILSLLYHNIIDKIHEISFHYTLQTFMDSFWALNFLEFFDPLAYKQKLN